MFSTENIFKITDMSCTEAMDEEFLENVICVKEPTGFHDSFLYNNVTLP